MEFQRIRFSIADGIARIVLDDPATHNAVDLRWTQEIAHAVRCCDSTPGLKAILIAATGKMFSVGGNINDFMANRDHLQRHVREMTVNFHTAISGLHRMPVPVLAAVNGMAAGGGFSFVLMSDLAIAKRSAKFNFAYTRSGLTPDGGATFFLTRLVGPQRAFDLLALNPTLTADEAQQLGLVARVVDDEVFEAEVEKTLQALANSPSGAAGRGKLQLRQAMSGTLEEQLEIEGRGIAEMAARPETLAMLESFLAKKK
ncbi:MAG: enoyl-CoA hydratase/isomerase family protein [Gammaproteobacteria bacterium]|nr:enoyl-CoA hydratase/isomerase family protein [Gammaproteobacteria bacterium]